MSKRTFRWISRNYSCFGCACCFQASSAKLQRNSTINLSIQDMLVGKRLQETCFTLLAVICSLSYLLKSSFCFTRGLHAGQENAQVGMFRSKVPRMLREKVGPLITPCGRADPADDSSKVWELNSTKQIDESPQLVQEQ